MAKIRDEDRSRRTLYVTGFDSKRATKDLLKELFTQGGPVVDVTMCDTHAYVLFQHQESVPYCLALFSDIELHDKRLRLSPRFKTKDTFNYVQYLAQVRNQLRDEYMKQSPPHLPAKIYTRRIGDTKRGSDRYFVKKDGGSRRKDNNNNRDCNSYSGGQKRSEQPKAKNKRNRGKNNGRR